MRNMTAVLNNFVEKPGVAYCIDYSMVPLKNPAVNLFTPWHPVILFDKHYYRDILQELFHIAAK